ncbi:O-fucosyltransferase family protein [Rhynchospora pubera]|uniref:O-fucosyltransferase family protein n=1 Tax=Rhynchospora pubera TaxID=906938 RepID=A0AAV8EET8_9POAL|nr:O-fucosyltransferase family protein [Rhynchospora pubera]
MASARRRLRHRWRLPAAISAVFFLSLLVLLSFLAPPLREHPALPDRRFLRLPRHRSSSHDPHLKESNVSRSAVVEEIVRVPHGDESARDDLWMSKLAVNYYGCSVPSNKYLDAKLTTYSDRYLMIATSGGLNQQRTGITDAVVAARILNATLVVPKLDQRSFWKDASNFGEIFDVDWFISFLSKDVRIIKELPKKGGRVIRGPHTTRVPRKCTQRCYLTRVLPVLLKKHVVQLTKFDYRLANRLDTDLQKLRCKVNYHSLRFTNQIQEMGDKLIGRMRAKSQHFIALHLRFEPDMLAFSGCYYGGGDKERMELGKIRKRWKTLHTSNPEKERRHGKCPLTPEEVGLMLRALGYDEDVHIYVASGEIYGGNETLAPLKALFPNFHSKETLASKEELAPFAAFSSRMAALDFVVCDESDAFVTNNNGNMAKILAGRRRYFGHKRTIRPNAKKLYSVFLNRNNMTWDMFATKVRAYQKGFMGEPKEIRPGRGEFHENPAPCICERSGSDARIDSSSISQNSNKGNISRGVSVPPYINSRAGEVDLLDLEYGDDSLIGRETTDPTDPDSTDPDTEDTDTDEALSD